MAQTPWGEMPVQDSHVHFFSHDFYAALARQKKMSSAEDLHPLLGWEIPAPDPALLAHQWITEMDAKGVERAAIIGSIHGDETSISAAVAHAPQRFYGYFMLDPTQSDALDRLSAAAVNPRLHAVCLFPAMHTYSIADSRVVPLLELASDSHLTVFVHCGAISVGVRSKLGLPSQFNLSFSNPLDLHPVALHFPKIRFVIPHFGAGLLRETLMLADLCPNVLLDTSSSNRWMRYEGLELRTVWQRAIDVVGFDRLLFGTDSSFFPRGWHSAIFEQQVKTLYELGIAAPEVTKILRFNLENLHARRIALRLT
jgi:predicted TIM-barrel fold metal-dependent hydrolase